MLLDADQMQFGPVVALNPTALLPLPEKPKQHDCLQILAEMHGTRPDLMDQPLRDADFTWYTDGSSFLKKREKESGSSGDHRDGGNQRAELIALTQALQMAEGKKLNVYMDSRYAFATAHIHGEIYRRRGLLTSEKRKLNTAKVLFLPQKLNIIHCLRD